MTGTYISAQHTRYRRLQKDHIMQIDNTTYIILSENNVIETF